MRFACGLVLLWLLNGSAHAVSFHGGPLVGLMQQPTSQYYHLVQGGYLEAATEKRAFIISGQYIERPQFVANGFVDQDVIVSLVLGSQFLTRGPHGLSAGIGVGQVSGYIRPESKSSTLERRGYQMEALSLQMDYELFLQWLDIRVSHSMVIGRGDETQTNAFVAWPYSVFALKVGVML